MIMDPMLKEKSSKSFAIVIILKVYRKFGFLQRKGINQFGDIITSTSPHFAWGVGMRKWGHMGRAHITRIWHICTFC